MIAKEGQIDPVTGPGRGTLRWLLSWMVMQSLEADEELVLLEGA